MSRMTLLSSPLLLGFEEIERLIDRVGKGGSDGYPPYNIERMPRADGRPETLRITLAVAGFTRDQLEVTVEDSQLLVRGRQEDDKAREYLHRGIAARGFTRAFVRSSASRPSWKAGIKFVPPPEATAAICPATAFVEVSRVIGATTCASESNAHTPSESL